MSKRLLALRSNRRMVVILGIVLTVVPFVVAQLLTPPVERMGWDTSLVRALVRSLLGVLFMIALGGISWLRPNVQKIRDAWRYTRFIIAINIVVAVVVGSLAMLILLFLGEATSTQVSNFLYATMLCILVGINEEVLFRGMLFGGLLAGVGDRRNGPLIAALVSSFAFGFAHVMGDISLDAPMSILQGLLKTMESGMLGFILCVPVLEGRNILGAMTIHAFLDWVLMIGEALDGTTPSGSYVSNDPTVAIAACIIYGVFCLLYLPTSIKSFKRLGALPLPQYGPFVPESQSAPLISTAWQQVAPEKRTLQDRLEALVDDVANRKTFNHKVVTILVTFVSLTAACNLVTFVALLILPSGAPEQVVTAVGTMVMSLVFLLCYQRLFEGRFDGVTGWSATGMLLVLPAVALVVANVLGWPGATFNNPLTCLFLAVAPALSEEVVFRGISGSNWMRVSGGRRDILPNVVVTSAAFALAHGLNLLAGASSSATLFQLFYAFCTGVLFSAVMLRTGSIWPGVILHALINFSALLTMDMSNGGILAAELTLDASFWCAAAASLALVGWSAYLLRPARQDEVVALWNRKWCRRGQPEAADEQ